MKNFLVIGFAQGAVYGLLALGLALVYKGARVFNFAQGEFGTVACFVAWLLLEPGSGRGMSIAFGIAGGLVIAAIAVRRIERSLHEREIAVHSPFAVLGRLVGPTLAIGVAGGVATALVASALFKRPMGWPIALPLALGTSVAMGLLLERVVVRPLFDAPRITLLVATAGVALLSIALELILGEAQGRVLRPFVGGEGLVLFDVQLKPQRLVMMAAVPIVALALAWFFSRTNMGLAILAMSQEPLATRLAGIRIRRTSAAVWGIAALLGGIAGLLQGPIIPFFPAHMTSLALLPGFTAAVLGGITSLWGALAGGFVVGIVQSLGQYFIGERVPGGGDLVVFIVLLGVLLFRPRGLFGSRTAEPETASIGRGSFRIPFVPAHPSRRSWLARRGILAAVVVGFVVAPALVPPFRADQIALAFIFMMIGLSMNMLMGYAGQISLGHQAFVGIGAFTSANLVTEQHFSFWIAIVVAAATGAIAAGLFGLVALRLRGLYLALITLAYGAVAQNSIFGIRALTRGGAGMPAPRPHAFEGDRMYAYLCMAFLALILFIDWRFIASKAGRAVLAIRQNEQVAASFGIDVTRYKVFAFVLAGIYAGVAGALFAHRQHSVVADSFNFQLALTFVLMTVVGGLGSRVGIMISAAVNALLPLIFNTLTVWVPLIGAVLLLFTLIRFPGGIGQQLAPLILWLRGGKVPSHKQAAAEPAPQPELVDAPA
jgi:branched-chain amino acid transport system permease protein